MVKTERESCFVVIDTEMLVAFVPKVLAFGAM
jgi:hypothetical protein